MLSASKSLFHSVLYPCYSVAEPGLTIFNSPIPATFCQANLLNHYYPPPCIRPCHYTCQRTAGRTRHCTGLLRGWTWTGVQDDIQSSFSGYLLCNNDLATNLTMVHVQYIRGYNHQVEIYRLFKKTCIYIGRHAQEKTKYAFCLQNF